MANSRVLIKLLVVIYVSLICLMRPVTSTVDQLPNLETIGIRATKISTAERFTSHTEQLAVFPQLRFTCPTTLYKLWYIGQSIRSREGDSILAPQLLILSPNSTPGNTYTVDDRIELNTVTQFNMEPELIESIHDISVDKRNIIIAIRYPVELSVNGNNLSVRTDLLYEPGVERVQSYFINENIETEIDLNLHTVAKTDDYPLIAVETDNPECVSGFLSILILESLLTTLEPFASNIRVPLLRFGCAGLITNLLIGGMYTEGLENTNVQPTIHICSFTNGSRASDCDREAALVQKSSNVFSVDVTVVSEVDSGDALGLQQQLTSQFVLYGQRTSLCGYNNIIIRSSSLCPLVAFNIEHHSDSISSQSCASNFVEDKAILENTALLIDSITFITHRPTAEPQTTADESDSLTRSSFSNDRNSSQQFSDVMEDSLATGLPPNTEPTSPMSEQDYVCIFPKLRFENSGTIYSWTFAALKNNPLSTTQLYPQLQIWRGDGTQYRRVSSSGDQDTQMLSGYLNVYKTEMKRPLQYNKGDIVGIYQPRLQVGALSVAFVDQNTQFTTLVFQGESNTDHFDTSSDYEALTLQPLVTLETSPETLETTSNLPVTTEILSTKDDTQTTREGVSLETTDSVTTTGIVPGVTAPQSVDIVTIGAAGGGGLIAIILSLIIIFVIVVVIIKRKRKRLNREDGSTNKEGASRQAFDNPVYTKGDQPGSNDEAQLYETPISLRSSLPQTIARAHEEPQPYETPTSSLANSTTPLIKEEPLYHILEQNTQTSQSPAAPEYHELELVVPTREQRNNLKNFEVKRIPIDIYGTLKEVQDISVSPTGSFFIERDTYWKPASNQEHLYQQLANNKYREIPRHHIQITGHLGGGQFGTVNKGKWQKTPVESLNVAIKTLQPDIEEKYKIHFLQEAAICGQFRHPNIVTLYGVVTIGEPVMIILELLANGDLRSYLNKHKPTPGEMATSRWSHTFLEFCQQIAAGMDYLSKKGFVHRDLAARNILVTANKNCKITDFGMSRDLDLNSYYISSGGVVPVKWTAPEAIQYNKYSKSSDVWSFGAVMYEIWSFGRKPFGKYSNQKALELINEGYRLPPPPGCPKEIYRIMIQCWHPEPSLRPSFATLLESLLEPKDELLHWLPEDLSKDNGMAAVLGAPSEEGEGLFHELQNTYMCT